MNHSLPLPEFLQQSARVLEDARFAVSSLPNIEQTTAGHYIERLVTTRSILEGINDFTLLSEHEIRSCRLWRDVRKDSLEAFRRIFFHLEKLALLDPDSPIHLVCLYLVFQPRIQASLDRAGKAWNRHGVRTARSKTPLAMYELSRERAINAGYWTGDPGDGVEVVDEGYGEDGEANFLPPKDVLDDDPVAPRSDVFDTTEAEKEAGIFIVDDDEIAAARSALGSMDFSEDDGNFGIDIYCTAVTRLFATLLASDNSDD
ncbi:hypothetical protein DFP72DRAFT_827527 [Ephemerocybe angulata]|uniref:Integrase core domain-containing protein n=1 Tax=Ephemerocybe angulata TaxID=980116 RepID=A0A8H6HAV3_9AGAR|nr:hypothetical protein DFP72DRAFT_827527 [Tulosesus angulatus]